LGLAVAVWYAVVVVELTRVFTAVTVDVKVVKVSL
jgi:hypothetical protein